MTLRIAENIRSFRKARKMTQEQLAEALGVTVGAVSKWESGASTPDIALIVSMADFFETSVDVLLGYDWRGGSMGQSAARIRALRNEKKFDEASAEAERALQKYPNSFEIVFQSAIQYSTKGVERRCKKSFRRALALMERSLELLGQNTDPRINEWSIKNGIAELYQSLGQTEEALALLKQNNADGLNNASIGLTLASVAHKPDEALPFLSDALVAGVTQLIRIATGYENVYTDKGDTEAVLAVSLWMRSVLAGLKRPGVPCYFDRVSAQLLSAAAGAEAELGDEEAARTFLAEAKALAERFDAAPEYGFSGMRFFSGGTAMTAFDDFGETALAGVERTLSEKEKTADRLRAIWQALETAPQQEPDGTIRDRETK